MVVNRTGDFAGKVAFVRPEPRAASAARRHPLAFAREGAGVVAADVSEQGNQETARMLENVGAHAMVMEGGQTVQ